MAAVKMLQIVGYKNSGKTTLLLKLLRILKENGYKSATIKHHGHTGPLEMPQTETDSMRFFHDGALSSLAVGGHMVQMHIHQELDFRTLLTISSLTSPDIILVEGFKQENEPKIVIVKEKSDWQHLQKLDNIRLVLAYGKMEIQHTQYFDITDEAALEKWLLDYMEGDGLDRQESTEDK